jgi:hypothetical protein
VSHMQEERVCRSKCVAHFRYANHSLYHAKRWSHPPTDKTHPRDVPLLLMVTRRAFFYSRESNTTLVWSSSELPDRHKPSIVSSSLSL